MFDVVVYELLKHHTYDQELAEEMNVKKSHHYRFSEQLGKGLDRIE